MLLAIYLSSEPQHTWRRRIVSIQFQIDRLTAAINRLAAAIEQGTSPRLDALGGSQGTRYTCVGTELSPMMTEQHMAAVLGIKPRTLGDYRRRGKLPGCWVKNGKRVCYYRDETCAAWKKGLP